MKATLNREIEFVHISRTTLYWYECSNSIRLLLVIVLVAFVPSCRQLDEEYDSLGKYRACIIRLNEAHARDDARTAISRRDYHIYFDEIRGIGSGAIAPGIAECDIGDGEFVDPDLKLPINDRERYSPNSYAQKCEAALENYKLIYNKVIYGTQPVKARSHCRK